MANYFNEKRAKCPNCGSILFSDKETFYLKESKNIDKKTILVKVPSGLGYQCAECGRVYSKKILLENFK